MPSRKSEARRSDVTTARFALADDDKQPSQISSASPTAASSSAPAQAPETPAAAAANGASHSSPLQQDKKDKDKDKDKVVQDKDKDGKDKDGAAVAIEDLTLPKSIITRLAKGVLPPNTQIQGNAILAISKSATVFVSYLASQ